ncbi:hypothetical protein [Trinickia sp. EG282A]|uniref:hypothetical protein n=1 Tax=Trinickia sp. EG282A TaxID=3237013 RepID=UPI0034D30798
MFEQLDSRGYKGSEKATMRVTTGSRKRADSLGRRNGEPASRDKSISLFAVRLSRAAIDGIGSGDIKRVICFALQFSMLASSAI